MLQVTSLVGEEGKVVFEADICADVARWAITCRILQRGCGARLPGFEPAFPSPSYVTAGRSSS